MSRTSLSVTSSHENSPETLAVAELFCGCGGLSHGFHQTGRYRVAFGNDIKEEALRTFAANHAADAPALIERDIREVTDREFLDVLAERGIGPGELDCLVGGPPCQGFSQMRRSTERKGSEIVGYGGYDGVDEDPRNDLVLRFLEVAAALRPKTIVIENVAQMLRHTHEGVVGGLAASISTLLAEMGYEVEMGVLNAADYGVPQTRARVFFLASRVGKARLPEPTHADPERDPESTLIPWVDVRAALADLGQPLAGPADELTGAGRYAGAGSTYSQALRSPEGFPGGHLTRRYEARIIETIREMRPGETWDSAAARMRAKYEPLIVGEAGAGEERDAVVARLAEQGRLNPVFFNDYYWSAYTRLAWDRPALTITANANFLGSGRFTHPEEDRGITVREAARLQSFPDDFAFLTNEDDELRPRIGVALDMIGEAVPPLLAAAIAAAVADILEAAERQPQRQAVAA